MKKHYETHVEDTDKLISVAGPVLDYKSWYEQLGIDNPRMNIDETEVLLHIEHYDVLFPPMMTLEEDDNSDIVYPFPTYAATSTEFNSLITSDEWSTNTKDYDI